MYVNVIEVFADGGILRHRLRVVELVSYFASPQVSNLVTSLQCYFKYTSFVQKLSHGPLIKDRVKGVGKDLSKLILQIYVGGTYQKVKAQISLRGHS